MSTCTIYSFSTKIKSKENQVIIYACTSTLSCILIYYSYGNKTVRIKVHGLNSFINLFSVSMKKNSLFSKINTFRSFRINFYLLKNIRNMKALENFPSFSFK